MHLGLSELLDFYRGHADDDALVLGTVVATEGSTYRKPGATMLIAADGTHCGLISGGCLESDLALQAARVFDDGEARNVCYDLSSGDELVWGLGIGCDGVIHLLLQRLQR
ncbi:MAG: XdhC family protein, partial [Lysobacterales bacterium]